MKFKRLTMILLALIFCFTYRLDANDVKKRWQIIDNGTITWKVDSSNLPHYDHIEMAGQKVAAVLRYGVNKDGAFYLERGLVWPTLRTVPNNTHASLMRRFGNNFIGQLLVNHRSLKKEKVKEIRWNGTMEVESDFEGGVHLTRVLFPSVDKPFFLEKCTLTNTSNRSLLVEVPYSLSIYKTKKEKGVDGSYQLVALVDLNIQKAKSIGESASYTIKAGEQLVITSVIGGFSTKEKNNWSELDVEEELSARKEVVKEWSDNLVLKTPDPIINTMFNFAKIRGAESIYKTKGGFLHGPGGESYYAAIWANDQAEYINPFFPFLGYEIGNKSALTSFQLFASYMNPEYKPIPSSIIAEGTDIWNGAGDRGDAAMIAYGAARYCLALGDKNVATELWPLIEWCLEYCHRQLNEEGVVSSNTDELEGRFPAGKANLCTSSLYYDALLSANYLGQDLKKSSKQLKGYLKKAKALRKAIDAYFATKVEGFDTYQYYEGNDLLRSWICIPLTMGITERKEGTLDALFSERLWTKNGLLTQAGTETFWDRSTLYGFRGALAVGETERVLPYLEYYSATRLLGEHVPYAIEAWPEGEQRHLSAESGLYCRIMTEGLFGIRPIGLKTFLVTPQLPRKWNDMSLDKIRICNGNITIQVTRSKKNKVVIVVSNNGKKILEKRISNGGTLRVRLKE